MKLAVCLLTVILVGCSAKQPSSSNNGGQVCGKKIISLGIVL